MTYAIARINRIRADETPEAAEHRARFAAAHATQPGFLGSLALPLGHDSELVLNLWKDEASAVAGRAALADAVHVHLHPLLNAPSELLGAGEIDGWEELRRT